MSLYDSFKTMLSNVIGNAPTIATTPLAVNGLKPQLMPAAIRPLVQPDDREMKAQKRVVVARRFDEGLHEARLTDRLREFLGEEGTEFSLRLNFARKVSRAVSTRLVPERFDYDSKNATFKQRGLDLGEAIYDGSRMKGKRGEIMHADVRDGEHFLLVDYDAANARPRFTPVQRYVSAEAGGDGQGMVMVYPNNDLSQKPLYAAKLWTEISFDAAGIKKETRRITLYFSNRAERYALKTAGWVLTPLTMPEGGELPPLQWLTDDGKETGVPLGLPVVHIKTPEMRPAALEAIPIQKGLNKAYLDMLSASDLDAMRLILAFGWDARDPETGKPLRIDAGSILGTTAQNASAMVVEGSSPENQIAAIDKQVALMADVTETPLSLLNRSNQRAAEGTLQEEKESFIAKVREYADAIELAFEDAFKIAVRYHNAMVGEGEQLPEDGTWTVEWKPFSTRSIEELVAEAAALLASGFPEETVWADVWGKTPDEIKEMKRIRDGDGFEDPEGEVTNGEETESSQSLQSAASGSSNPNGS